MIAINHKEVQLLSDFKITLAAARVNAGLRQEDAAKLLGVSKNKLIAWEKGEDTPKISQLRQICSVYDIESKRLIIRAM